MNKTLVRSTGIVEKYLPLVESWEPKSNSLFINSMCKELIDYLDKNTTFDLFPQDMRKAKEKKTKYTCENGQSIVIDSEGVKLLIEFIKDLHTNEELKILLKNIRDNNEKYDYSIIIFTGETNQVMLDKIEKFVESNKIQIALIKK